MNNLGERLIVSHNQTNSTLLSLQKMNESVKESWSRVSPKRLYDICILKIVSNIELIIKERETKTSCNNCYQINDSIRSMPKCIWQSLIKAYAIYYHNELAQRERDDYFNTIKRNNTILKSNSTFLNVKKLFFLFFF
jgi:hypothetical protein